MSALRSELSESVQATAQPKTAGHSPRGQLSSVLGRVIVLVVFEQWRRVSMTQFLAHHALVFIVFLGCLGFLYVVALDHILSR